MARRAKGEGTFTIKRDNLVEYRIVIDGKRKSFYGRNKQEAKKKYKEYKESYTKRKGVADHTVDELILKWLRDVKRHELKPSSYDRLERTITVKIIPAIGFYTLEDLDEELLQVELINYYAEREKSYSNMKKIYDAANAFLKWAVSKRMLPYNPMDGVSKISSKNFSKKEIDVLMDDEIKLIIQEIDRVYSTGKRIFTFGKALLIMLYTGIREGELLGLQWGDFDERNKLLHIRRNVVTVKDRSNNTTKAYVVKVQDDLKTYSSKRVIALNDDAVAAIKALEVTRRTFKDDEFIVHKGNNEPWKYNYLIKMFNSILERAGVQHHNVHALRHTWATKQFENGVDIKIISAQLGHSSVKVTYDTYIHIIKTIEAKKLAESGVLNQ